MTDNRTHLTIIIRLLMRNLNPSDHVLQVEIRVTLCHLRADCLESIVDVIRVVLKLTSQLCTSECTGNNIQCQSRKNRFTFMCGCAVALLIELLWPKTMIFKSRIDEDHQTLNGMVCCGANDSRTEYDVAAPISVD